MPITMSITELTQYRTAMENGSMTPVDFYNVMKANGYQYAGWAKGVATGMELAGIAAVDYLKNSARDGAGGHPPRTVTDQDIESVRRDMAIGYAKKLEDIANSKNGNLDRDVNFKETEDFHKTAFEKNGFTIDNWTLKIPMDLIRETQGEDAAERIWRDIRDTGGSGPDTQAQNIWLTTRVGKQMSSANPSRSSRAKEWMNRVPNTSNWSRVGESLSLVTRWGRANWPFDISWTYDRPGPWNIRVKNRFDDARKWQPRRDPLIFDLNNNGLDTVGINVVNPILFDHDGDGIKTSTGWVASDDGFLVLDRNNDGNIGNGSELFGDATPLYGGGNAVDGFAALAQEDSNLDGKVDNLDAKWNQLRVWRDLNQDGISQVNELFTLDHIGIAAIKVAKTTNSEFLANGNQIADLGTFVRSDGTNGTVGEVGTVADINLAEDTFTSKFVAGISVANGIELLPDVMGSGVVRRMQEAASIDSDAGRHFKEKLIAFAAANTYSAQHELIDELIVAWGATSELAVTNILNLSADEIKRFNTLEKFNGTTILPQTTNINLEVGRVEILNSAWEILRDTVYQALVLQTRFRSTLGLVQYTIDDNGVDFDFSNVNTYFRDLMKVSSKDNLGELLEFNLFAASVFPKSNWAGYQLLVDSIQSTTVTPEIRAMYVDLGISVDLTGSPMTVVGLKNATVVGSDKNDYLSLSQTAGLMFGRGGKDQLFGGAGNDYIDGGDEDDELIGNDGNDLLNGGNGNDVILGGGDDDRLSGDVGDDRLFGGDGDDTLYGEASNDTLLGGIGNDELTGGDGDDILYGNDGDDTLDGGAGDDTLDGGSGNNVYYYGLTSGNDTFQSRPNSIVKFGNGILERDLKVRNDGYNNLIISFSGVSNILTVRDYFLSNPEQWAFSKFVFASGTEWSFSAVKVRALIDAKTDGNDLIHGASDDEYIAGGAGDDSIYGHAGNDTLDGGVGNDFLDGGTGSDNYRFGRNSGADTIWDITAWQDGTSPSQNIDTILLDPDISPTDVKLSIDDQGRGFKDLLLTITGTTSFLRVRSYYSDNVVSNDTVERIQFSDGTIWSVAEINAHLNSATEFNDLISGTAADDILDGLQGSDQIWGKDGNDSLFGGLGSDFIFGENGNDLLRGGGDDDALEGGSGGDTLYGEDGDDGLNGGDGDDTLDGGVGNDYLYGENGSDTYKFGLNSGYDTLFERGQSSTDVDVVLLEAGVTPTDLIASRLGSTDLVLRINGSDGKLEIRDYFQPNYTDSSYVRAIEKIQFSNGAIWDYEAVKALILKGTSGYDEIIGFNTDDLLNGELGNDSLIGGSGSDTYKFDLNFGDDIIIEEPSSDINRIVFGAGILPSDILVGRDFNANDLWLAYKGTSNVIHVKNYFSNELNAEVISTIKFADNTSWSFNEIKAKVLIGNPDNPNTYVTGFATDDTLSGGSESNYFNGMAGSDTYLYGKSSGDDTIIEVGDTLQSIDVLLLDAGIAPNDISVSANGVDLEVRIKYQQSILRVLNFFKESSIQNGFNSQSLEKIQFADGTFWDISEVKRRAVLGTDGPDMIIGLVGNDLIVGGTGDDYLSGKAGNDTYIFNRGDGADVIENRDTLNAIDTLKFGANILESDVVAYKTMYGTTGNLTIRIRGSNDQVTFSNYYSPDDVVNNEVTNTQIDFIEFANGVKWDSAKIQLAVDKMSSNHAPTIGAVLPATISAAANTLFKFVVPENAMVDSDLGDSITYSFDDPQNGIYLPVGWVFDTSTRTLSGQLSKDASGSMPFTLYAKDDYGTLITQSFTLSITPYVNHAPTLAVPIPDQSIKPNVQLNFAIPNGTFVDVDFEDALTYRATLSNGSALPTWLSFNGSSRMFSGTPTSAGSISVKVTAKDTGNLSVSDVFDLVVSVGNLVLSGTSGIDTLTGGDGNDSLSGLAGNDKLNGSGGNDVLDGGAGTDTMIGGFGDDTFVVDVAADVVTENLNEGNDTIKSSVTLTLPINVENLLLTSTSAINGTGNALNNVLTGNSAVNVLDGGAGADTLIGAAGNDIYTVDNLNDVIVENANEGTDQVNSSVTYTLSANVENLTLTGTSNINATGNAAANVLTGNAGNNVLDGGVGNDSMVGGAGNDTYVVDSSSDTVTEATSAGTDLVQSSVSYTLGTNLENLTLTGTANINATGNTAANILFGNSGNNVLDGGTGADTMTGGAGNDIYVRDNASDVITENANEGIDQVKSSLTYTLISNLEALLLTGSTAINGTGNELDNLLTGNSGKNVLNGGAGNDILQGAAGDDTLTDTAGKNIFDGGAGIDVITAGIGNDFIAGGLGNDTITTGTGVDVVAFNRGDGMDTLVASTGKDNTLSLGKGIKYADLLFKKSGNDLILVTGTSEQVTMKDWYTNVNNRSIANLQIVIEGTTDYNAASTNKLNNRKIGQFNFDGLAAKFDQARAANPSLTSWALSSSLLEFYLAGSDTSAIGGDLAYQYAKVGNLSGFSMIPALNIISNAQYGSTSQTLQPVSSLKDTTVSLV